MFMTITGINSLDITSGKLLSPGYLVASWTDDQLEWNRSEYNGIVRFSIASSDIWTPLFVQFDATDSEFNLTPAWVYDNGTVILLVAGLFEGTCELDVLRYPFDEHVCYFAIQPSASDASEIQLRPMSDNYSLSQFSKHGEWDVTGSISSITEFTEPVTNMKFISLTRTLTISRRHMFTTMHTSIPLVLLATLNLMVFLVPLNSGERITFSTSILLNFVFFTSNISENLPHNSLRLSYCSMFMATLNVTTSLGVIVSVILCRMQHETVIPVPVSLKLLVAKFIACRSRRRTKLTKVESIKRATVTDVDEMSYTENETPDKEGGDINVTWSSVAEMLDCIIFDINLLVLIIIGAVFSCLYSLN